MSVISKAELQERKNTRTKRFYGMKFKKATAPLNADYDGTKSFGKF